ncbi:hypothetical protein [Actinomycetospora flava]|uniref:Uncharacterized protein n=1 Tax=Actinomycetospora flava TaxID=3129232 RepID=A0ABU8MDB6_9PSEU
MASTDHQGAQRFAHADAADDDLGDRRDNDRNRLHKKESFHLAAISTAQLYTPSTVEQLTGAINRLPAHPGFKRTIREELSERRRRHGGGRVFEIGTATHRGRIIDRQGFYDDELPDQFLQVWLTAYFPMPATSVLVATFVLCEESGSLYDILRTDVPSTIEDVRVHVHGRFGKLYRAYRSRALGELGSRGAESRLNL